MAISAEFLEKIRKKTGMAVGSLRNAARKKAHDYAVPLEVGALILAQEHGVTYGKYATPDELALLRNVSNSNGNVGSPALRQPAAKRGEGGKAAGASVRKPTKVTKDNSLFLVHGRDDKLVADINAFLRALRLNPLEWSDALHNAPSANPNIGTVVNRAMGKVQAVLVMFSPDE